MVLSKILLLATGCMVVKRRPFMSWVNVWLMCQMQTTVHFVKKTEILSHLYTQLEHRCARKLIM